jgi:uncharacterized OB-fold protein
MSADLQNKYSLPLPEMEPEDKPYWESLKNHQMRIQQCSDCAKWCFQPKPFCPHCLSDKLVWTPVSGRGRVWASTTLYQAFLPSLANVVPLNISIVELEEGVRVTTNVIGCPVDQVKIGMPVEVVYDDVTDEVTLAKFRPVEGALPAE